MPARKPPLRGLARNRPSINRMPDRMTPAETARRAQKIEENEALTLKMARLRALRLAKEAV